MTSFSAASTDSRGAWALRAAAGGCGRLRAAAAPRGSGRCGRLRCKCQIALLCGPFRYYKTENAFAACKHVVVTMAVT